MRHHGPDELNTVNTAAFFRHDAPHKVDLSPPLAYVCLKKNHTVTNGEKVQAAGNKEEHERKLNGAGT